MRARGWFLLSATYDLIMLTRKRKGGFNFAQSTLPLLLKAREASLKHPPTLIFTGATASLKGSATFSAFASGKFALRALAQSLAREFGPQGVHVSHVILDGVIDIPRTKSWTFEHEDAKIDPVAVSLDDLMRLRKDANAIRLPIPTGICTLSRGQHLGSSWISGRMLRSGEINHSEKYARTSLAGE